MTNADGGTSDTLGVVDNLPIDIAGIRFYVQAHVSQNSPFDLLLGRPFIHLVNGIETPHRDGTSTLTLTDPNNHNNIRRIPTRERYYSVKELAAARGDFQPAGRG